MIMSVALVLFLALIPPTIRKYSLIKIVNGERGGIVFLLVAKLLHWYYLLELIEIWFPNSLVWYLPMTILLIGYYLYKDRKHMTFPFRKKIMKTS